MVIHGDWLVQLTKGVHAGWSPIFPHYTGQGSFSIRFTNANLDPDLLWKSVNVVIDVADTFLMTGVSATVFLQADQSQPQRWLSVEVDCRAPDFTQLLHADVTPERCPLAHNSCRELVAAVHGL